MDKDDKQGKENIGSNDDGVKDADAFMEEVKKLMEHPVVPASARPDWDLFQKTHELRQKLMAGKVDDEQQMSYAKQRSMLEIVGWVLGCRLEQIVGKLDDDLANQLSQLVVHGGMGGLGRDEGGNPAKQLRQMLLGLRTDQIRQIVTVLDVDQIKPLVTGLDGGRLKEVVTGLNDDLFRLLEAGLKQLKGEMPLLASCSGDQLKQMMKIFTGDQIKKNIMDIFDGNLFKPMMAMIDEDQFKAIVNGIDDDLLKQIVAGLNANQLQQLVKEIAGEEKAKQLMQALVGLWPEQVEK